ncbi:MAG: MlaD family protein [Spirochaetaceae bacterium]|jgi:phospholipid/cholesterol/gamma-HCH transport system substrate-binding protein|nr:MlaD family protein [Spirochaetaceae bacterium]
MKFKIRFADQIVGVFIVAALISLIFVIIMLGTRQRWFAKDFFYKTYFDSAAGLGDTMVVQYKGFPIGRVRSVTLTNDDQVEVTFSIYDQYQNRVREGSLVELIVSPIGLGNQFVFHPGRGEDILEEGTLVPVVNSPQGRNFVRLGLANIPPRDDRINQLMAQVDRTLENLNTQIFPGVDVLLKDMDAVLVEVKEAVAGTDATVLGRTLGGVDELVNQDLDTILADAASILEDIKGISGDLEVLAARLSDPQGAVLTALDRNGAVYQNLEASLKSIAGTLRNLERTSALLPAQVPGVLAEVRNVLQGAQDLLTSLLNNPLLKGGVPIQVEIQTGGTNPRDIPF